MINVQRLIANGRMAGQESGRKNQSGIVGQMPVGASPHYPLFMPNGLIVSQSPDISVLYD
jgi:hypothetical protein